MTRALFFGDTPHRLAGSQRSLVAAVVAGRAHGLDPVMVFPAEGVWPDACRASGLGVRILEGTAAFHTFGKALLRMGMLGQARVLVRELLPYCRRLARLVDAEKVDVVHFNTARGAVMVGLGAHLSGRDLVLHVRGAPAIGHSLWSAAQGLSARLILVAHALENHLAPSARPRARVVYNGVAVSEVALPDRKRAAVETSLIPPEWLAGDALIVVALSSLVPFKGLHHLVRAARSLQEAGIDVRFVLAGTGLEDRYEAWLRGLPRELGVSERVVFTGFVDDVATLLASSDALVLPSVERERLDLDGVTRDVRGNEGLPRSVLEAMSVGRVVVASDIAGVREQVEPGRTGLVVAPGDVRALHDALARVARDRDWRRSAGAAALEVARARFGLDAAGRGLVDVLREASASRPVAVRAADAFGVVRDALAG